MIDCTSNMVGKTPETLLSKTIYFQILPLANLGYLLLDATCFQFLTPKSDGRIFGDDRRSLTHLGKAVYQRAIDACDRSDDWANLRPGDGYRCNAHFRIGSAIHMWDEVLCFSVKPGTVHYDWSTEVEFRNCGCDALLRAGFKSLGCEINFMVPLFTSLMPMMFVCFIALATGTKDQFILSKNLAVLLPLD